MDLVRRYNATRRQHPIGSNLSIDAAIDADIERMEGVDCLADVKIDSTGMAPADLRQLLLEGLGVVDSTYASKHYFFFLSIWFTAIRRPNI